MATYYNPYYYSNFQSQSEVSLRTMEILAASKARAEKFDKEFDRRMSLLEDKLRGLQTSNSHPENAVVLSQTPSSGPELCVSVETDMLSKGTTDAIGVDEDSSKPELELKAYLSPVYVDRSNDDDRVSLDLVLLSDSALVETSLTPSSKFPQVQSSVVGLESGSLAVGFDVMVESVEPASAEIDLASVDVTDKSDSAIATDVFEDGDLCLDVSTIDSTEAEVISGIYSVAFSSMLVLNDAEISEECFGTKFCAIKNALSSCLQPVCENASMIAPSIFMKNLARFGNWCCIQTFQGAALSLNPPKKPPDSFLNTLQVLKQLDVTDISSTILILVCKFAEVPWRNTSKHVIAKADGTIRLKSFCEACQLDEAVLFVNHAFESNNMPSTWKCNHLVDLLGKGKKYESAFSVKRKMDLAGIVPSFRTFDVMVECNVHENRPHLGPGVAGLITKQGFVVKMYVVNLIIKTLLQNGEISKATELFRLVGRNGLAVDVVSYKTIINGHCKAKKMEEAHNLLIEMKSNNCSPNLVTHSILMDGLCKSGKVEEAMMLLNKNELLSYSLQNRRPSSLPPKNDLKIGVLDEYVAELENGVDSLFEGSARFHSQMLSVGQIAGKFGDHACFSIFQREAIKDARRIAGLEVIRSIDEQTMIFMEYEFEKKSIGAILVFDPGGGIILGAASGIVYPHMQGSVVYYGHTKSANKSYELRGHDFSLSQLASSSYAKHLIALAPATTSHWICQLTKLHVATSDNASAQQFVYNWLRMLDAHIFAYGWTANREKFQE